MEERKNLKEFDSNMAITAKEVQALREKTGAGMLDCKKALEKANGNFDEAVNILREKGLARSRKRDERSANEGMIHAIVSSDRNVGVVIELNCETDFVARTSEFQKFAAKICPAIAEGAPSPEEWRELIIDGAKASETLDNMSTKIGEKLELRRFERFQSDSKGIEIYIHAGGKLGVMLDYEFEGDESAVRETAHNLAMQIAAANPIAVSRNDVPAETIESELEIYRAQARNEGKPENLVDRIAQGKINKFYQDVCLLEQMYVKEQKTKISQYLAEQQKTKGVKVVPKRFVRYALGGN